MNTTSFIKRHVSRVPLNQIFTTRDLLLYGTRTAVDQAVSKLVKNGLIVRLARGVFIKQFSDLTKISVEDVARAKAQAFGKHVSAWGGNLANKLGLLSEDGRRHIFCVNGSSSSFQFGNVTIQFKKACPRRARFSDESYAGVFLGALWYMGEQRLGGIQQQRRDLPWTLSRTDREYIRTSLNWLPAWLSSIFVHWKLPRWALS